MLNSSDPRPQRHRSGGRNRRTTSLSARGAFGFPVSVQRALHLYEPDDRTDQREQKPEAVDPAHRALATVEVLVHVPNLGRDDEVGHGRDDDVDDETHNAPDAVARIAPHLLLGLVSPDKGVDPERKHGPEDGEPDRAGVPDRPALSGRRLHSRRSSHAAAAAVYVPRTSRRSSPSSGDGSHGASERTKMCDCGCPANGVSIALSRTLEKSDSGQPPPKRFEPHS